MGKNGYFGLVALFLAACGAEVKQAKIEQPSALPTYTKTDTLQKTEVEHSEASQAGFALRPLEKPTDNMTYKKAGIWALRYDAGEFMLDVRDFVLGARTGDSDARALEGTNKGQYVHLNLDNNLHLHTNDRNVAANVPDGNYRMGCFLVRSYHESVKQAQAAKFMRITVKNRTISQAEPLREAAIFYGVPLGDYSRKKSADILLDFYLANTDLGKNDNKVRLKVNNNAPINLEKWSAYLLTGLPLGRHRVELVLVDRTGNAVSEPIVKYFRILE